MGFSVLGRGGGVRRRWVVGLRTVRVYRELRGCTEGEVESNTAGGRTGGRWEVVRVLC